jgi:hypothetical protein
LKVAGASRVLYSPHPVHCPNGVNRLDPWQKLLPGGKVAGEICFKYKNSDAGSTYMFHDDPYDREARIFFFSLR